MEAFIIIVWLVLCGAAGKYASNKGRSGLGIFLLSLVLSPLVGFVVALVMSPNPQTVSDVRERAALSTDEFCPDALSKKCPNCAETVKFEALVCRFCGHKYEPEQVEIAIQQAEAEFEKANASYRRTMLFVALLVIVAAIVIGIGINRSSTSTALTDKPPNTDSAGRPIPDSVTNDADLLIYRCGAPSKDDSTEYDNPRPQLPSRTIEYNKAHLRFAFLPAVAVETILNSGGNRPVLEILKNIQITDPPPYKWKQFGLVDMVTNKAVSAGQLKATISRRLPCFLGATTTLPKTPTVQNRDNVNGENGIEYTLKPSEVKSKDECAKACVIVVGTAPDGDCSKGCEDRLGSLDNAREIEKQLSDACDKSYKPVLPDISDVPPDYKRACEKKLAEGLGLPNIPSWLPRMMDERIVAEAERDSK